MKDSSITTLIDRLLGKPMTKFGKFHDETKIKKFQPESQKSTPQAWKIISYKSYPRLPLIFLPPPEEPTLPFIAVLKKRTSSRAFGKTSLSLEKISTLLYFTNGIQNNEKETRFYPSAGARFPLETYIILLRSDLPKGLYHYNIKLHALELLLPFKRFNTQKYTNLKWVKDAGGIILTTAIFDRTTRKYGERGYRHILQEVGAINQNIYLLAALLSLNVCAIGAFLDDKLNTLLDIDSLRESIVSVLIIGEA